MNNNNRKPPKFKGKEFVKSLPHGWTTEVIKLIRKENQQRDPDERITESRHCIYQAALRLSIKHPAWPFIAKIVERVNAQNAALVEHTRNMQTLQSA